MLSQYLSLFTVASLLYALCIFSSNANAVNITPLKNCEDFTIPTCLALNDTELAVAQARWATLGRDVQDFIAADLALTTVSVNSTTFQAIAASYVRTAISQLSGSNTTAPLFTVYPQGARYLRNFLVAYDYLRTYAIVNKRTDDFYAAFNETTVMPGIRSNVEYICDYGIFSTDNYEFNNRGMDVVVSCQLTALLFPSWGVNNQHWYDRGKNFIDLMLDTLVDGIWPEPPRYTTEVVLPDLAIVLPAMRYIMGDDYSSDPRLLQFLKNFLSLSGPLLEYAIGAPLAATDLSPNTAMMAWGDANHSNSFSSLVRFLGYVTDTTTIDMIYGYWWYIGRQFINTNFFFTAFLGRKHTYVSYRASSYVTTAGLGILRQGSKLGLNEVALTFKALNRQITHWHQDQGTFEIYGFGSPLALNTEAEIYESGTEPFVKNVPFKNIMFFSSSDNPVNDTNVNVTHPQFGQNAENEAHVVFFSSKSNMDYTILDASFAYLYGTKNFRCRRHILLIKEDPINPYFITWDQYSGVDSSDSGFFNLQLATNSTPVQSLIADTWPLLTSTNGPAKLQVVSLYPATPFKQQGFFNPSTLSKPTNVNNKHLFRVSHAEQLPNLSGFRHMIHLLRPANVNDTSVFTPVSVTPSTNSSSPGNWTICVNISSYTHTININDQGASLSMGNTTLASFSVPWTRLLPLEISTARDSEENPILTIVNSHNRTYTGKFWFLSSAPLAYDVNTVATNPLGPYANLAPYAIRIELPSGIQPYQNFTVTIPSGGATIYGVLNGDNF